MRRRCRLTTRMPAGADKDRSRRLCVLDVEILRAVAVHGQRAGRIVGKVQLIAAPRQLHQLVVQIMVIVGSYR